MTYPSKSDLAHYLEILRDPKHHLTRDRLKEILEHSMLQPVIRPNEPNTDGLGHNLKAGEWGKVSAQLEAFAQTLVSPIIKLAAAGEHGSDLRTMAEQHLLLMELSAAFGKLGHQPAEVV